MTIRINGKYFATEPEEHLLSKRKTMGLAPWL